MTIPTSTLLFYGGITGAALFALAGIICGFILRSKGRKLRETIANEYK